MKHIPFLIVMLVISSCATYSELQTKKPAFSGNTDKTPEEFVACTIPKIMEPWGNAKVIPDGKKLVIVVSHGGYVMLTITAIPKLNGSKVLLRQMASLRSFTNEWQLAKSCL